MYLGLRENWKTKEANEMRQCIIKTKSGATWNAFLELEKIISEKELASQYLGISEEMFAEKLEHCGKHDELAFDNEEYTKIATSLRDIAKRLLAHADEIERAEICRAKR